MICVLRLYSSSAVFDAKIQDPVFASCNLLSWSRSLRFTDCTVYSCTVDCGADNATQYDRTGTAVSKMQSVCVFRGCAHGVTQHSLSCLSGLSTQQSPHDSALCLCNAVYVCVCLCVFVCVCVCARARACTNVVYSCDTPVCAVHAAR